MPANENANHQRAALLPARKLAEPRLCISDRSDDPKTDCRPCSRLARLSPGSSRRRAATKGADMSCIRLIPGSHRIAILAGAFAALRRSRAALCPADPCKLCRMLQPSRK